MVVSFSKIELALFDANNEETEKPKIRAAIPIVISNCFNFIPPVFIIPRWGIKFFALELPRLYFYMRLIAGITYSLYIKIVSISLSEY